MYQACGGVLRGSVPCSAVPVLEAICTPGIAPFCWVNFSAATIKSVSLAATCAEIARRCGCGAVLLISVRSGPSNRSTRYGRITTPEFAIPAAIIAFCSGVTATSFCPILDIPTAAASDIAPTVDSATCSGIGAGGASKPNASAVLRNASPPSRIPSWTNAVLQDRSKASRSGAVGALPQVLPP